MRESTTVGVFETLEKAMAAVTALRNAGFEAGQIGLLSPRSAEGDVPGRAPSLTNEGTGSHWEVGAGIGAATGAATGAGFGLAVVSGLVPGLGPVLAGGVLAALLAPATAGAAAGSLLGAILGLGVPADDADYFQGEVGAGRALVTVRAGERAREAEEVLRRVGALPRGVGAGRG